MRCPECKSLNLPTSGFCGTCGLILVTLKSPQRRREDLVQERRRSEDRPEINCRFCDGKIREGAVRCMHCSQILDEEFVRKMMQRRRAQINYASWVAYILGLFVLLIFKPVGLLAIGAGLVLSIIYYALPVDPTDLGKTSIWSFIKKQVRLERVEVPIPAMRSRKLIFLGTPIIAALAGYMANYLLLQRPMNQILEENAAYRGMKVQTHYQYWVIPGVLVYDLRSLDDDLDPLHVHTAMLQYAFNKRQSEYDRVELHYRGKKKIWMDGNTFKRIGEEYGKKNFQYVLFDFTGTVKARDRNTRLDKVKDPNEALVQFHRIWYANEELSRLSRQKAEAAAAARAAALPLAAAR